MKGLVRSDTDRMIGGVCGGLGQHWGMDPLILRILFVIFALVNGVGLAVYVLLWIFVPLGNLEYENQEAVMRQNIAEIQERATELGRDAQEALGGKWGEWDDSARGSGVLVGGLALVALGVLILLQNFHLLPWIGQLWPLALIAIGVVLLLNNMRDKG